MRNGEDGLDLHLECAQDAQVGYKGAHGMGHEKTSRVFPKVRGFFHLKPTLCLLTVLGDGLYWKGAIRASSEEDARVEQPGVLWVQHSAWLSMTQGVIIGCARML